jgi:hypothetical protein
MHTLVIRSAMVAGVGLLVLSAEARADEAKVPLDQLPKVVRDAVQARFPNAKLVSSGKETEDGKPLFEVAIKHREQNIDVTLTPEGKIIEIEGGKRCQEPIDIHMSLGS